MSEVNPVIHIRGGGFSGLTLAYFLLQQGHRVKISEPGRVGGLISTQHHPLGLVETAANGLLNSQTLEEMCKTLKVDLLRPKKSARKRYIFFRGRAQRWPLDLLSTLRVIAQLLRLRVFKSKSLRPRPQESVEQYATRVFSKKILDALIAPALQGIYAGDPSRMSARLVFGRLFGGEILDPHQLIYSQERGSFLGSVAPREGMGELIASLQTYLKARGVEFVGSSEPVKKKIAIDWIEKRKDFEGTVEIWATSVSDAAEGVKVRDPSTSNVLAQAEMLPLVTVTQFYPLEPAQLKGFGCLFARGEGVRSLGVLFNSHIFENRSLIRSETWILGGALDREVHRLSDAEINAIIVNDRKRLYGESANAIEMVITRWPTALPHLTTDWEKNLESLRLKEDFYLHGNYLGRIGLTQILERSKALARRISEKFSGKLNS